MEFGIPPCIDQKRSKTHCQTAYLRSGGKLPCDEYQNGRCPVMDEIEQWRNEDVDPNNIEIRKIMHTDACPINALFIDKSRPSNVHFHQLVTGEEP